MSRLYRKLGELVSRIALRPPTKHQSSAVRVDRVETGIKNGEIEEATANRLLQEIVDSVVEGLGFRAAMVSVVRTLNGRPILSVQAFAYTSGLSKLTWAGAGKRLEGTILQIGESIAGQKLIGNYVTLDEIENLGVRAIKENARFAFTESLYDLFAPRISREIAKILEDVAQLHAFVTIPFKDNQGNLIGNLFAGTSEREIPEQQIKSLEVFSRMTSIAIHNSQLLHRSEILQHESQARLALVERTNRQLQALENTVSALLSTTLQERRVFQEIVDGAVVGFDLRAAFLSVVERDNEGSRILPVRAFSIHPDLPVKEILETGQKHLKKQLIGAFVHVSERNKEDNLGVRIILDKKD